MFSKENLSALSGGIHQDYRSKWDLMNTKLIFGVLKSRCILVTLYFQPIQKVLIRA